MENNSKYKLVIFDLDGTLMDTSEGIFAAVRHTIDEAGLEQLSESVIRTFIGPPIQRSFAATYKLDTDKADELAAMFRKQYSEHDILKAVPYDGIYDVLKALADRGIMSAVATYKREDYAIKLLSAYHIDDHMSFMHGSDMEGKLTKSDIIIKCIEDAGVSYDEVVMVGDTKNDEKGAIDIGVDFIGVTFGFGYKDKNDMEVNEHAIACVDTPMQILEVL